jgi:G:T/U-mismatch repair DNA glycosylase
MGRRDTRRHLSELFADIPPRRRRAFVAKAWRCLEQAIEKNADPEVDDPDAPKLKPRSQAETVLSTLKALELLSAITERADKHQEAQRKLLEAIRDGDRQTAAITGEVTINVVYPEPSTEPPTGGGTSGSSTGE